MWVHRFAFSTATFVALSFAGPAGAQIDTGIAKCVNDINKSGLKVIDTQFKDIVSCVKLASRNALPPTAPTPSQCIQNDLRGKVIGAFDKVLAKNDASCDEVPTFGYAGPDGVNDANLLVHAHVPALLGSDPDSSVLIADVNPPGAKCQGLVLKSANKGLAALLKSFNKCKKVGLKDGSITNATDLEGCYDPSERRAQKATDKIVFTINDKCDASLDLDSVFPGDCVGQGPSFGTCTATGVICTGCLIANAMDDLNVDCDLADDGVSNLSCLDPPIVIPPGFDCFQTAPDCSSGTQIEFGGASPNPAIPADFFEPGSQPFEGVVQLRGSGDPFVPDTLIERLDPIVFPEGTFPRPAAPIDIEIRELHLQSCQPITVLDQFNNPQQWQVQVQLSEGFVGASLGGQLNAQANDQNGGEFTSQVQIQPAFNFFRVDFGSGFINGADFGPFTLLHGDASPWSRTNEGLTSPDNPCVNEQFFPGILNDGLGIPCCEEISHDAGPGYPEGHQHVVKPHGCLGDCVRIPAGDDCWSTECGRTEFSFCDTPIPAGFFDPGSLPFEGKIQLEGSGGGADTRVNRLLDMDLSGIPPVQQTVDIQLVELSLQSCTPIVVDYGGSTELWDVSVTLDPTPSLDLGNMTVTRTHENGGIFSSDFPVKPIFTFTRQGDLAERVLDPAAILGLSGLQLESTGASAWVNELDPATGANTCSPTFHPGVDQNEGTTNTQCCRPVGHSSGTPGHVHETGPPDCSACPMGGCCTGGPPIGVCALSTEGACAGTYFGDGTTCADSDGDSIPDGMERNDCSTCFIPDPCSSPTNPSLADTDGDGVDDDVELGAATDPCDAGDF